jgi:hypothetical protein
VVTEGVGVDVGSVPRLAVVPGCCATVVATVVDTVGAVCCPGPHVGHTVVVVLGVVVVVVLDVVVVVLDVVVVLLLLVVVVAHSGNGTHCGTVPTTVVVVTYSVVVGHGPPQPSTGVALTGG